jgi:hypothetical protein
LAAALLIGFVAVELGGKVLPATPYGTFLDQLEAGNIASVTFEGNEIKGRFKHPIGDVAGDGAVQGMSSAAEFPISVIRR